MGTGTLAFIGDAVYEVMVRESLVRSGLEDADKLHFKTVEYVRAESQAFAVKKLMDSYLTQEEIDLVKRARNHKMPNRSRSAGIVEYKLATGLEALIGSLYMEGKTERLREIMSFVIDEINAKTEAERE